VPRLQLPEEQRGELCQAHEEAVKAQYEAEAAASRAPVAAAEEGSEAESVFKQCAPAFTDFSVCHDAQQAVKGSELQGVPTLSGHVCIRALWACSTTDPQRVRYMRRAGRQARSLATRS